MNLARLPTLTISMQAAWKSLCWAVQCMVWCKQRTGQHQSALLPPRAPGTVALHRTSVAAGDWTKKHTQGTKRKLDFEGCDDPRNFKPQGEPNKKKKQESIKSSSACTDSFSYVSKVDVAKQTHLDSWTFFVGIDGVWGTLEPFNS